MVTDAVDDNAQNKVHPRLIKCYWSLQGELNAYVAWRFRIEKPEDMLRRIWWTLLRASGLGKDVRYHQVQRLFQRLVYFRSMGRQRFCLGNKKIWTGTCPL
ncbi:hypothetical protein NPIL_114741 [Nephila pilipes]|uniref:Uncharacterized protein n=1 Tax=Nephila pilipes TaxID=299642 RepID=A0A8X6PMJ6_NEPPI|nr:hypothetical protein NPIL_114741 [Nephila pilipes]